MPITRAVNATIGVITLVASLLASVARYESERGIVPRLLLTAAVFGFTAVTLAMTWRRRPDPGSAPMSAGFVWLVLLVLTTMAVWDLIPTDRRPMVGLLLALVVGATVGTAVAPRVDLGPDDERSGGRGVKRW
ncbi:hypothetical protein N798_14490 [Knoellia flava TL1]|uniref:Uncharacterized protein n=2 Tax=Knoellia flava TaxID=913969 RepID=A0A8H9KR85_9MICO|nr:hypothetical protein [Knoellia flava]KGN29314.1 hypothetical protein N798_14490 [Knoellia flava TL1]GGB67681.1 hypothetical protein GCM10011314_03660 [Knoellia flava]